MNNVDIEIENYILKHIDPEDELLYELNRVTHLRAIHPRMLSGHLQGSLLTMLCKMLRPKRVLELGTFTGYATICLAKGISEDAHIHTIECNDEIVEIAQTYFEKCGVANKITSHVGDALQIIPTIDETFDLVFLDAEKTEYSEYYKLVMEKLPSGGLIIADNVLWSGKVIETVHHSDHSTKAILEFNEMVARDTRVEKVILPIRDGLTFIRRK